MEQVYSFAELTDFNPDHFDLVSATRSQKISLGLDSYRYTKAINAVLASAGGFDAMIAYTTANNSPGSNAVRCLSAVIAAVGTGTTPGGDYEAALIAWLTGSTTASPAGLGLTALSSPTLSDTLAALRGSAYAQSF